MSNPTYHTLKRLHAGPFALTGSIVTAGSPGTGWPGTAVSFIVVGWRTREETDIDAAHFMYVNSGGSHIGEDITLSPGTNDQVNLRWSVQAGMDFDHFAVYAQTASAYDYNTVGRKLLPIESERVNGNIPGTARSCSLQVYSGSLPQSTVQVPLRLGGSTPFPAVNQFTVRGNFAGPLGEGSAVQLINAGANNGTYTLTDAATVAFDNAGEYTLCTVGGSPFNTAITTGDALVACGYFGGQDIAAVIGDTIIISRGLDDTPRWRELSDMSAHGYLYQKSILNNTPIESMVIRLSKLAFNRDYMYARMLKWADQQVPVVLDVVTDGLNSNYFHSYLGRVVRMEDLGSSTRRDTDYTFEFRVESVVTAHRNLHHLLITAVDTGADTFSVKNDVRYLFPEEGHFEIDDSTGNDGHYAGSSTLPTYDAATNQTTIKVSTALPDATVDGKVIIYALR